MKFIGPRGFAASFALAFAALFFASAAPTPAHALFGKKKKTPEPVVVIPPPEQEVQVGPPVLAGFVIDQATAYATYMRTASAIPSTFTDSASVASALKLGSASEQKRMQQGVVAYAAIIALQDAKFTETVREWAKLPSRRDAIIRYILADPNYVTTLDGHQSAAGLIVATLNAQGAQLRTAGEAVRKTSYDIQLKSAWSKKSVPNPMVRLAEVRQLSASGMAPASDLREQLAQAATQTAPMSVVGQPVRAPYNQSVVRGMAIAALAILGRAGEQDAAYLQPLLVNDGDGFCFNMAKLNLYQCLSVARPWYEDVYCLGLHAMGDTGRCVMSAVGTAEPVLAAAPLAGSVITASSTTTAGAAQVGAASAPLARTATPQ